MKNALASTCFSLERIKVPLANILYEHGAFVDFGMRNCAIGRAEKRKMKERSVKIIIVEYIVVVAMATLMAFNYILFIVPNSFAPSGLNGIATMIQYKLGFSIGWMSLLVNVPLCVLAFFLVDKAFSVKTLVFCVVYSGVYLLLQQLDLKRFQYDAGNVDTVLPCVIAGLINGFLIGVCFRCNASSGGTDIVAKFVNRKNPRVNFFWVTFGINAAVAAASFFVYAERVDGAFVYNYRPVVLCMLYCFTTSFVGNFMLKGSKTAYKFVVITKHAPEIEEEIVHKLHRSATLLSGVGAYSNEEKDVLLVVVAKHQIIDFQNIIRQYPDTFSYVETVNETIGNFKRKA